MFGLIARQQLYSIFPLPFSGRDKNIIMDKKVLLLVVENRQEILLHYARLLLELYQSKRVAGIQFVENPQRKAIWYHRREMLKEALKTDCTHILSIDTDVIPSMEAIDALLAHDEDFISGFYCMNNGLPCVIRNGVRFSGKGVEDVDVLSMGFSLMKREVAEKVEYTEPVPSNKIDGDAEFCKAVKEASFSVKVDFNLRAPHLLLGKY
jgi:hypothetical protein